MGRLIATALLVWLCQGCFAFEELEKGEALMDQYAGRDASEEPAAQKTTGERESGPRGAGSQGLSLWTDKVEGWWHAAWERKSPERDPGDIVVRCELGDTPRFTRKSDCLTRGGRIL